MEDDDMSHHQSDVLGLRLRWCQVRRCNCHDGGFPWFSKWSWDQRGSTHVGDQLTWRQTHLDQEVNWAWVKIVDWIACGLVLWHVLGVTGCHYKTPWSASKYLETQHQKKKKTWSASKYLVHIKIGIIYKSKQSSEMDEYFTAESNPTNKEPSTAESIPTDVIIFLEQQMYGTF